MKIDGHVSTAYLKAVDGGHVKTAVMDEPIGPENMRIKHGSVVEIEPITIDLGLSGANDVLKWIQNSWRKEFSRRNGQITHADFDLYETYEHQFFDALITETVFPALDGASKDAAYLKIKVQPERIVTKKLQGGRRVTSNLGEKQKLWTASSFRLKIDTIPEFEFTNKIESFTIKQGIKKLYTGEDRFPQIEPTKIEFPHITGTLAAHYVDALQKWHDQANVVGTADPKVQKHGSLEYLGPKNQVLFRIELNEVGLLHLSMTPSTANSDQIKRMKFEMYVGRMDIDGQGVLGLE
ncbi:MAG: phage tail protein [Myxococcales bacterium]|nr:phage tail protein [Myxococcales bacterium]